MNFRSTNPEGYAHLGGDIMSGANCTRGVLLSSNAVRSVSDNLNEDLLMLPKGTGALYLGTSSNAAYLPGSVTFGASTSVVNGIGRGVAVPAAVVALPASGLVYSTITIPGVAVGDALFISRSTGMSTALGMAGAWVTGANEGSFAVINNLASTASISSGATFPYFYVKA